MLEKIKIDYGKSNTFMIFGMLLLGTFFLLLLVTVDTLYSIGFMDKLSFLAKKISLDSKSLYLVVPILVLILYSIGFTLYLASFIFLSSPSWIVMKFIYNKKLFAEGIVNEIFRENNVLNNFKNGGLLFKRGFLYFLIRNENDAISSDVKFAFTQLMYGRAILFTIVMAILSIFGLIGNTFLLGVYGISSYFIAILIYAMGLKFFDDILSMGYLSKNLTWLDSNKTYDDE